MTFEYRYRFSGDKEKIRRHNCRLPVTEGIVRFAFEMRTNFIVKGDDYERIIDSERYALPSCREELVRHDMVRRLEHYWMPHQEIQRLINEALLFAKQIAAADGPGLIQTAVDLNVYTVQQEGEAIGATVDRAMRPEYLPPLHLCPALGFGRLQVDTTFFLPGAAVRVYDVEKALAIMEMCVVCGRKPMVGTEISSLLCGHAFHNHCILRRLDDEKCCPICHLAVESRFAKPKHGPIRFDHRDGDEPREVWNVYDDFLGY